MKTNGFSTTDAVFAAQAEVASRFDTAKDVLRAAQIAEIRVLAEAGHIAERQAVGSGARTQAHDMALRSIAAELAAIARMTDRAMQAKICAARELVDCFPITLTAWEDGRISRGHVYTILDAGRIVPGDQRAEFETAAVEISTRDTPNRVRPALEMLAHRLHPRSFTERHREAAATRCVRVVPGADGMSDIVATVPTVIAEGIHDRLTRQARAIVDDRPAAPENDDHRGMDAVRADVFSDLLLAGAPSLDPIVNDGRGTLGTIRATVQIVVPMTTLLGADDGPADLVGRSPIDADTVRALAGDAATWERLLTHPVAGMVLGVDRYRPTAAMRRFLRGRDQHCRFPGCRQAAIRCEIDHTTDHAIGGPTHVCNLEHLCQRHHSMKQFTAWRVRQLPGGVLEWTSPLGRIYREDAPIPAVWFAPAVVPATPVPSEEPAPF